MDKMIEDDFDEGALFGAGGRSAPAPASGNPLAKYFRVPGLDVALPTRGAFFSPGAYKPNMADEVGVFPLRASDELLLKSPDALMSGEALVRMIESCVPSIRAPMEVSTPDLDVLLLAIRAASYGEKMDIDVDCPECKHENSFDCDIPSLLATGTTVPSENVVRLNRDVVVYLRPYNLHNATRMSMAAFNETRKVQASASLPEDEQIKIRNESFRILNEMSIQMSADCIIKVVIPEGEVTDKAQILEMFQNVSREWTKKVDDKLKEINSLGVDKQLAVVCASCGHGWHTEVEFDPTTFFEQGS